MRRTVIDGLLGPQGGGRLQGNLTRSSKLNVLGVLVDAVDYERAVDEILDAAEQRRPYAVTALAVHGVMTGVGDPVYRYRLNDFDLVVPDGQPVRWALNALHGAGLRSQVRGTTVSLKVMRRAADAGMSVYLYGSTQDRLTRMRTRLSSLIPSLRITGATPSRFGAISASDLDEVAREIDTSGARILFVGLGCPRQEQFTYEMRARLSMPVLAVGAAFDYIAGTLQPPPNALQRVGMEWAWRFALEPTRLWKRYLVLNPAYLLLVALQLSGLWDPLNASPAAATLMEYVDG